MRIIRADDRDVLEIARVGEQEATQVRFATEWWYETFGAGGRFELEVERPTDDTPYLVGLSEDDSSVFWTVSAADAAIPGRGRCQLSYYLGSTLAKTRIWDTRILASLSEPGESPPDPWEGYIEQVHGYAEAAEASAQDSAVSAAEAELSARRAEQIASKNGYFYFEITNTGRLLEHRTDNVGEDLIFAVTPTGRLEVTYGA